MSRRTRVPGPITQDQTMGNSGERQNNGLSRWRSLDLMDGSWTKYDVNAHIKSVSSSADGNRVSVYAAKSNMRWTNDSQTAGRWHTKLIGPDGNALTFSDFFSVEIIIELHAVHANNSNTADKHGVNVGIADSDVTDSNADCHWAGVGTSINVMSSGTAGFKMFTGGDTSYQTTGNNLTTKIYSHISPPIKHTNQTGPSTRMVYTLFLDVSDNDLLNSNQAAVQTHEYTASDPVYLYFAPFHTTNNTNLPDMDATWKVWYRVNLSRDGLAPTFVPGGGLSG